MLVVVADSTTGEGEYEGDGVGVVGLIVGFSVGFMVGVGSGALYTGAGAT